MGPYCKELPYYCRWW